MTFPSTENLEGRAFWVIFAVLGAIFCLPILWVWHPPAMDLPGHLALAQVFATRHSPNDPYSGLFSLPSWPSPNTLYYYAVGGLGRFVPIAWASKGMLCLALVGTPLALGAARRANGDGRALALVGFPLALTFNFIAGFVGFVLALPLMIWLGALARRQVAEPSVGRAWLLGLVGVLVYLAHAQVFLFSVGLVGLIALCGAWPGAPAAQGRRAAVLERLGRFGATIGPMGASVLLALPWYVDRVRLLERHGGMDMRFPGLAHNLRYLPIHTFDQLTSDWDSALGLGVVAGMGILFALSLVPRYRPKPAETGATAPGAAGIRLLAWASRNVFWLAALAAAVTYFAMPGHIRFQAVLNGRQAVVALLLVAVAVRVPRGRLPAAVLGVTFAFAAAYGALYARATFQMNREIRGFPALLAKARPGSRLTDPFRPKSRVFRMDVLRQLGSYHMVWNRGLVSDTFARWPVQPVRTTRFFWMPGFAPHRPDPYHYVLSGRPLGAPRLAPVGRTELHFLYRVLPLKRPPPAPRPAEPRPTGPEPSRNPGPAR